MDLFKKLKSGATKAADMAQQTVEVTKLTAQVASRKRDMEKCKALLGHQVYEAYLAGDVSLVSEKVKEGCRSIQAIEKDIAGIEQQIKRIRNEKMCSCGKQLATDVRFCPDCGRPQLSVKASVINIDAEPAKEGRGSSRPEQR